MYFWCVALECSAEVQPDLHLHEHLVCTAEVTTGMYCVVLVL